MSSPSEVEVKFQIDDIPALVAQLRHLGFEEVTPRTHEINTLFDLPGRPLRARGEVLRLRKYGDLWVLTHKAKGRDGGPHKNRVETETRVEDGQKMEGILRAIEFAPSFRYEKFRAEWKGGEGHVVIDETPIGNFGEIAGPPDWIDATAEKLNIGRKDYVTDTYAGLFLAWKQRTGNAADEMTFAAVGR